MNLQYDLRFQPPAAAPLPGDIALGDVDSLLCAVKARLRALADGVDRPHAESLADHADAHFRAGVLECVDALTHVHEILLQEIAERRRLAKLVIDAEAALLRGLPCASTGHGMTLHAPMPMPMPEWQAARAG